MSTKCSAMPIYLVGHVETFFYLTYNYKIMVSYLRPKYSNKKLLRHTSIIRHEFYKTSLIKCHSLYPNVVVNECGNVRILKMYGFLFLKEGCVIITMKPIESRKCHWDRSIKGSIGKQTHYLSWTLIFVSMGEHIELFHLVYISWGSFIWMV
jgi:hypothetical protein